LWPIHHLSYLNAIGVFNIHWDFSCCKPNLGLTTKARACKVTAKRGSLGMKASVREWTFTLPRKLPPWELESRWIPKCSKNNCKSQNSVINEFLYIIGKLLKFRCLKWARITHLNIWNTSYGQKKGRESNWQFDSWPLKVINWPDFPMCRWCVTYCWKSLDEGYNFVSDLISIEGLHVKLWGPKVARVLTLIISGLPFGSLGTKCHLDVGFVKRHWVYYKGEGGGFPQVRAVVSLVNPSLFMVRPITKSAPTMH